MTAAVLRLRGPCGRRAFPDVHRTRDFQVKARPHQEKESTTSLSRNHDGRVGGW